MICPDGQLFVQVSLQQGPLLGTCICTRCRSVGGLGICTGNLRRVQVQMPGRNPCCDEFCPDSCPNVQLTLPPVAAGEAAAVASVFYLDLDCTKFMINCEFPASSAAIQLRACGTRQLAVSQRPEFRSLDRGNVKRGEYVRMPSPESRGSRQERGYRP